MKKVFASLLAVSVLVNLILAGNFITNAETLNQTWYNLSWKFSETIQSSKIPVIDSKTIILERSSLNNLQQQMFNLQLLPKGNIIVSDDTIGKFESLLQYQFYVLDEMEKEIKENGKISDDTNTKYLKVMESWDAISKSFNSQLKIIDPFSPGFSVKKWQKTFETALNAKNTVQLLPLSPKPRQ